MARRKRKTNDESSAPVVKTSQGANGSAGYSKEALAALERGSYSTFSGNRNPNYTRSEDQQKVVQRIPALKGMTPLDAGSSNNTVNLSFGKKNREENRRLLAESQNHTNDNMFMSSRKPKDTGVLSTRRSKDEVRNSGVDTVGARKKYAEKINYKPIGKALTEKDAAILYNGAIRMLNNNMTAAEAANDIMTGSSSGNAGMVQGYARNKDWKAEYGKSLEELIDEYANNESAMKRHTEGIAHSGGKASKTVGSTFMNAFVKPAVGAKAAVKNLIKPDGKSAENANKVARIYSDMATTAREDVKKDMSDVGATIYDIGTNVADRALPFLLPGGKAVGAAETLFRTAEDKRESLEDRGITGRSATAQSLGMGAVDAGLDIFGLEKIKGLKGLQESGNVLKSLLGSAAIGGGEQFITSAINKAIDSVANGENSEFNTNVRNYISRGMTEDDARTAALSDEVRGLLQEAGQGALFGSIMSAGRKAASGAVDAITGENISSLWTPDINKVQEIPTPKPNIPVNTNTIEVPDYAKGRAEWEANRPQRVQPPVEDTTIEPTPARTMAESVPQNPRLVKALEGNELNNAKTQFANNKTQIKVLQNEIDLLKNDPKNKYRGNLKKAVQADIAAREKEITRLRGENKSLDLQMKGGLKDVKDMLTKEQKNAIYGKTDSAFSDINFAVKFAGDTPEAKGLAQTAQAEIRKYINTGDGSHLKAASNALTELDNMAKTVNAEYTTQKGNKWNYNDWFGDQAQYLKNVQPVYDIYQAERAANKAATSAPEQTAVETSRPNTEVESTPIDVTENAILDERAANVDSGNNMPAVEGVIPNNPHTKTSKTYTNTGKRGGGWDEAEYEKYTDPQQFQYVDKSEAESMEEGLTMRQTEGREGFKNRVMEKERLTGAEIDGLMQEWRDLTSEAREMEQSGESAKALWDEAVKVFRKVQTQESDNAQAMQALAKWSRNTPEGMLVEAENILNGKRPVEKTKLRKEFEKLTRLKKSEFHFSDDFVRDFLNEAEDIKSLDPDSRAANERMAKLGEMVNAQLPSNLGEKVTTFLMDNMLGNFRTLITRNAGGNVGLNALEQIIQRPLAAGIDALTSLKTGKRTQAGLSKAGLAEYISGFAKGLKDEAKDFKANVHTSRTGENNIGNAIKNNRHVFKKGGILDFRDKLVKHGLSVGDRPFYEAVYKQTLGDYERLRASGKMGDTVQALSNADFKQYAETAASLNALSAVYQNDTKLSEALLGFKESIGDLSKGVLGVDVLSQFSMPFVKTPANVVDVGISYSPLGLIRNAFRTGAEIKGNSFDQNRFANETARNIIGTGLMGAAAAYAKNGGLSGSYSEDKDEKQAQKEAGEQEYAWNVPDWIPALGGRQMDIGWLPVVGSNAVAAAAAQDAYSKGDGNAVADLVKGATQGGKAMFDQSMFQGLQRLFGTGEAYNSDEGIVGNMRNVVKSGLGQGIPSSWRQIGQVIDPYQRDVANSNEGVALGTFDNYDVNNLINNLPILREMALAPKVNTSGELIKENQGRGLGSKILEDMILPGKVTDVNTSRLAEEAKRISDITGNKNSYLPKTSRSAVDTEEHTLTNKEWADYEQKYYGELTSAGEKLLNLDNYKNATPEEQEKTLDYMYRNLKSAINSEYNGKEITGAAKEYVNAGGGEKGVQAIVDYFNDKLAADKLGMNVDNYRKKNSESPNGAVEWAQKKEEAQEVGFVNKNGNVDTAGYEKAIAAAGSQSQKFTSDLPTLRELGLEKPAFYVYANAVQKHPEISPNEFAETYNAMNTNKADKLTQAEALAYFNEWQFSDDPNEDMRIVQDMWSTYNDGSWKKVPYLKKDGTWGAK